MPIQRTQNPTKKELLNRLTNIREKLSSLRQEEDKINQKLGHEYTQSLSKYLMDANAIEIEFTVLLGGMLEAISLAKTNPTKAEAWQKSGQMFQRISRKSLLLNNQKSNEPEEEKNHIPIQSPSSNSQGKTLQSEGKNKPHAYFPGTGDNKNANPNEQ